MKPIRIDSVNPVASHSKDNPIFDPCIPPVSDAEEKAAKKPVRRGSS